MKFLVVILIFGVVGCGSLGLKPIDDETNPLTLELLSKTVLVQEDKIEKHVSYSFPRGEGSIGGAGPYQYLYFYPYIMESEKQGPYERLYIRYEGKDWIFWQKADYYCASTDKKVTKIVGLAPHREVKGGVSETLDQVAEKAVLEFILSCPNLIVRLTGEHNSAEFVIDKNHKDAFSEAAMLLADLRGPKRFHQLRSTAVVPAK